MAERFWRKVDIRSDDECWLWTARRVPSGYGRFTVDFKTRVMAHRLAYELATGEKPGARLVCHRCDNPPCVNPRHLFLGTHLDNMRDAVSKGRQAREFRLPQTKLSDAQVLDISERLNAGERQRTIAADYGVSRGHIAWLKANRLGSRAS